MERMTTAMNSDGDGSRRSVLGVKDIAKPRPIRLRAPKKSPLPLRSNASSKKIKKPRREKIGRKKAETLMPDKEAKINFDAPATLRKWPASKPLPRAHLGWKELSETEKTL